MKAYIIMVIVVLAWDLLARIWYVSKDGSEEGPLHDLCISGFELAMIGWGLWLVAQ